MRWIFGRRNRDEQERIPPRWVLKQRSRFCAQCGEFLAKDSKFCWSCGAQVPRDPDDSVKIYVQVGSDEAESVRERLQRALSEPARDEAGNSDHVRAWWTRSRKAWAFTVGLATVVGAVTTVFTLVVH
jgi:hypothetical protein